MVKLYKNVKVYAFTTSQRIAETFGKTHQEVMNDVEHLECNEIFKKENILPHYNSDLNSPQVLEYTFTYEGYDILTESYIPKDMLWMRYFIKCEYDTMKINAETDYFSGALNR